ncbi:MAG: glycosyltransferase [Myxococcota bacterium]
MKPLSVATGFLRMQPMQLHKDVGQLPYHLARELGWSSELVYWMEEASELIEPADFSQWVRRVPVSISPSRLRHTVLFLNYLRHNARRLDVLLVYHLTSESLFNIMLYKALNPRGVAVLKLDMDHRGLAAFEPAPVLSKRGALMRLFAATPIDFLVIETESLYRELLPHLTRMGHTLHLLPIGIDCSESVDLDAVLAAKQNIVLTAGRLGSYQKHTELLVDALEQLPGEVAGDWQFWFVGTRTAEFDGRLAAFRRRRPDLAGRVQVRDFIASREELAALYRRSRVYCLTSRWESFGIVLGEAAYFGCYLLSTDVGAASSLTSGGQHGSLVAVGDAAQLAQALRGILTGATPTEASARWAHEHVRRHLAWPTVARRFGELVEQHLAARA